MNKTEPLNIGFIGCGGRGTGAACQALIANNSAVILAMGDTFEDRLTGSMNTLVKEMGQRVTYEDALASSTRLGPSEYSFTAMEMPPANLPGQKKPNRG